MPIRSDRRVRRTRDLLHRSLIALILEKGYGRVTVQDILDRADIGRSTFYSHFRNKDDLLLAHVTGHLRAIFAEGPAPTPNAGEPAVLYPARTLFQLADANRELYRALVGRRGGDLVARLARKLLTDALTEHLRTQPAITDETQLHVVAAFLANGLMGLLTWWLDTEAPLSADEMYVYFERLTTRGIHASSAPQRAGRSAGR